MIGVALKGLLGRKLRAILTALRDRARRRDDQRRLRAHRHAREELRRHLHRLVQGDRRRHQLQAGDQDRRRQQGGPGVLGRRARARCRTCPACVLAQGAIEDESRLVDENGKAIGERGRRPRGRRRPGRRPEPEPDPARQRAVAPRRRRDRDRQVDRRASTTSQSARPSARSATGRSRSTGSAGIVSFGSEGSIAGSTITVYDLATAQQLFDKQRQVRPDPRRRQERRAGRELVAADRPAALRRRRR